MSKVLLLLAAISFGGCLENTYDLSASDTVLDAWIRDTTVSLEVGSLRHATIRNGVATSDCITIADDTQITIDGVAGHVVQTGGLPFDADSCQAPTLDTDIAPRAPQLTIAVGDGATTLTMELTLVGDSYRVTQCGAARCDAETL